MSSRPGMPDRHAGHREWGLVSPRHLRLRFMLRTWGPRALISRPWAPPNTCLFRT